MNVMFLSNFCAISIPFSVHPQKKIRITYKKLVEGKKPSTKCSFYHRLNNMLLATLDEFRSRKR